MKENVLDILMYMFEHCMDSETGILPDEDALRDHLDDAGFQHRDIDKAFAWLEGLAAARDNSFFNDDSAAIPPFRVFSAQEIARLDAECRGFLMFMEQSGVLDPISRELVIDRAMALETPEIDLTQLKWVILMVLLNQPGQEAAFAWLEDLVFDEAAGHIH